MVLLVREPSLETMQLIMKQRIFKVKKFRTLIANLRSIFESAEKTVYGEIIQFNLYIPFCPADHEMGNFLSLSVIHTSIKPVTLSGPPLYPPSNR